MLKEKSRSNYKNLDKSARRHGHATKKNTKGKDVTSQQHECVCVYREREREWLNI